MSTVQATAHSMAEMKPQYLAVQDTGVALMQSCDPQGRSSIQRDLSALEQRWLSMDDRLGREIGTLEGTVTLWAEMEADMNEILARVTSTRVELGRPLPGNYAEIEAELLHCKVSVWTSALCHYFFLKLLQIITHLKLVQIS